MSYSCQGCQVRSGCVFANLPEEDLRKVWNIAELRFYGSGRRVLDQGERPAGVFVVRSGLARLSHLDDGGKRNIAGLAPPASVLGLTEVITGVPARLSARILEDSELSFIPREKFVPFLMGTPKLAMELLIRVSEEFDRLMTTHFEAPASSSPKLRLLGTLQEVAAHCGRDTDGGLLVKVPLTVQDLAAHVGLSRQWTTKLLQELVQQGLVKRRRRQLLVTVSGLKVRTNSAV